MTHRQKLLVGAIVLTASAFSFHALAANGLYFSTAVNAFGKAGGQCNINPQRVTLVEKRGVQEIYVTPATKTINGSCVAVCQNGRCDVSVTKG